MRTIKIEGYENYELIGYLWEEVEKPIGVVQIIHGMQEHGKRYEDFANYLNRNGYIVFASDLRGHGQTAVLHRSPYGYSDGDIFYEIVQDQIKITEFLYENYKLPISIFAHSFGSFIGQRYIIENGFKIKNIILSGSTYTNDFSFKIGKVFANIFCAFGGRKKTAKTIEKIGIGSYGKKFKFGNWLSRDDSVWEKYKSDSLCGVQLPNSFYKSLFSNGKYNYKKMENIPYYLPIMLISGENDPVGGKHGIIKLFYAYAKSKKKVFLKVYPGARHELTNEINKEEVYSGAVDFFNNNYQGYQSIKLNDIK